MRHCLLFVSAALWLNLLLTHSYADGSGFDEALRMALQGDAEAQDSVGMMYEMGAGIPRNHAEATKWYRKAAEQGNAEAQNHLGWMYEELGILYDVGAGVPRNHAEANKWFAEAAKWYRKSAEQGNANAQFMLGDSYYRSKGVPQDYAEAMKFFREAAAQGNADAQFGLGSMYGEGAGVPRDDVEAMKWYRKAAEQGNAEAQTNLGRMYNNGEGAARKFVEAYKWLSLAASHSEQQAKADLDSIEKKMTSDQIAEAQKRAAEWRPIATSDQKQVDQLQLPPPPIPPVPLTQKEVGDLIEKVKAGGRTHTVWGYGNRSCGEYVGDRPDKNGKKAYRSWLAGYVSAYDNYSPNGVEFETVIPLIDFFCQLDHTDGFDLAVALEVAYAAKQRTNPSARLWGYGTKSCWDYISDRTETNGDNSFFDWVAGYLTAYDIFDSLENIELYSVINLLDTLCQSNHSTKFGLATALIAAAEAKQKNHPPKAGGLEEPSTESRNAKRPAFSER